MMDAGSAFGAGKAGAAFDPIGFVSRPQVIGRILCWVSHTHTSHFACLIRVHGKKHTDQGIVGAGKGSRRVLVRDSRSGRLRGSYASQLKRADNEVSRLNPLLIPDIVVISFWGLYSLI